MRFFSRVWTLIALLILFLPAGFAASGDDAAKKNATDSSAASATPATGKPAAAAPAKSAKAQAAAATKKERKKEEREEKDAPRWSPMPATTGTLGLFTVETAEVLPKGGYDFSVFVNKFSRAPGEATFLQTGISTGVALTDRLEFYVQWLPHTHVHIGNSSQLSLDTPDTGAFQPYGNTFYRSFLPCAPPSVPCTANPAYIEDYPFAFTNGGGSGPVTVGLKYEIWSERHGSPLSVSLRNDVTIPTRYSLNNLLTNQTQLGAVSDNIGLAVSKHIFHNTMQATFNADYMFTRDPVLGVFNTNTGLNQQVTVVLADQATFGAGILMFPEKRFQIMSEYSALVYVGAHTPNTTFGPRDPVDSVSGVRIYPWRWLGIDAGYRYMLNLTQDRDRNGFVVKVGTVNWPEKVRPPDTMTTACSIDKNAVMAGSSDQLAASVRATDAYNHPLTYTWTATGGKIDGTGPDVHWGAGDAAPGTYTITARADDGHGNTSSCSEDVTVNARPIPQPTMSCAVDRSSVLTGERSRITATVNDQSGTALKYTWRTNGGQIVGSGASVQFDSTGAAPGTYIVTGRVENGKGGAADCSTSVAVAAPPPPPQASKINECLFGPASARVDNVCKRILDDVALRLQNEPKAKIVVIGYSAPETSKAGAKRADKLATDRAANAQKYLGSKGVDAARVDVRTAGGQAGAGKENHRCDIIWVPDGATY